jgi:esterase/lipase
MKRILIRSIQGVVALAAIGLVVYLLGPHPAPPVLDKQLPELPNDLQELARQVAAREAAQPGVKPGNASELSFADSIPRQTEYCLLYLHGFSASPEECRGMARAFAQRYHCNLYIPRLYGHGLSEAEPMLNMTADSLFRSAVEAVAVARKMGQKVIIMATSTGATLGLPLAEAVPEIAAFLLFSPNIRIFSPSSEALDKPWGLQLARFFTGGKYHSFEGDDYMQQYWTTRYRLEGLVALQSLVDFSMNPVTFSEVRQPVFLAYYYKNEKEQDHTVSVSAMLEMFEQLGTPAKLKVKKAFPEADAHVICNAHTSKASEEVQEAAFSFAEDQLGLKKR